MDKKNLLKIQDFDSLLDFLVDELDWPLDIDNLGERELTFSYSADEIGLSEDLVAKVNSIKQLRPFTTDQPWAIFWMDFEAKSLPITVLRRILRHFVVKKRAADPSRATWKMEDIMFVSVHGNEETRGVTFAHFKNLDGKEVIREFSWDKRETHFENYISYLDSLKWSDNFESNPEAWGEAWRGAFTGSTREAVRSSKQLAISMAWIARDIRDRVKEVYEIEGDTEALHKLYESFKEGLIHDMTLEQFADMYAQTMTYGLFSARTMDTDGTFEIHEVADLIPSTNPFLKKLFKECLDVGSEHHQIDLDELGIGRLVDMLDGLNKSDGTDVMTRILEEFGRRTGSGNEDPVIHFYEEFLKEYDHVQRVDKGVYYTPDPVVDFIVRSVNDELKTEFGLEMGLADTTTWEEMVFSGRAEWPKDLKTRKTNQALREKLSKRAFVQILDPAAGTGTFLIRIITMIHSEVQEKYKRDNIKTPWLEFWNNYVDSKLFPRLYGFEIMMASYSVAHMRIGMHLKLLGYDFKKGQRLNVYLTNTLESPDQMGTPDLFFSSIGKESESAKWVKEDRYFTLVIGNPPYSKISGNMSPEMREKVQIYKFINGKKIKEKGALQLEINLQDDYVKFIRFAQKAIEKSGAGILGYISNSGYLKNPTLRGMRWSLLQSFSSVKILDLHGEYALGLYNKKGVKDENVFDIQQGVSIGLFTCNKEVSDSSFYKELIGNRDGKYEFLYSTNYRSINPTEICPAEPFFEFGIQEGPNSEEYYSWPSVTDIFPRNSAGIITGRDGLALDFTHEALELKIKAFVLDESDDKDIYPKYNFKTSKRFNLRESQQNIKPNIGNISENIFAITHRPFDFRYIYYDRSIIWSMSRPIAKHFFNKENFALLTTRQVTKQQYEHAFVTDKMIEIKSCSHDRNTQILPLYLFDEQSNKIVNIDKKVSRYIKEIASDEKQSVSEIDIFDYVYAILYSPNYRKKYFGFLKRDFPRIPMPKTKELFWKLSIHGKKLRKTHLFNLDHHHELYEFPIQGSNLVSNGMTKNSPGWIATEENTSIGDVWINDEQYFSGVPKFAWDFYIGGYQPAQKWLKDRKRRNLSNEDIEHYQKIIVALTETDRIMKEIDQIEIE